MPDLGCDKQGVRRDKEELEWSGDGLRCDKDFSPGSPTTSSRTFEKVVATIT
jgi:hypothetical protein